VQKQPEGTLFQRHIGRSFAQGQRRDSSTFKPMDGHCPVNHVTNEQAIDINLARMFRYLDLQAIFANGIDGPCSYFQNFPLESTNESDTFSNLDEARQSRQLLLYDGYYIYAQSLKYNFVPKEQIPQCLLQANFNFINRLKQWLINIELVLQQYPIDASIHPLARPGVVRYSIVLLLIRLTGILGAPETAYDALYPHFEYLLSLALEVTQYESAYTLLKLGTEHLLYDSVLLSQSDIKPKQKI
jgi:hypothetical protein